jgi:hypothetical protein
MKRSLIIIAGLAAIFATTATSQTVSHWLDRQAHGISRHVTPRHHKPDAVEAHYFEHVYVEDLPGNNFRLVGYTTNGQKFVKFYSSEYLARTNPNFK